MFQLQNEFRRLRPLLTHRWLRVYGFIIIALAGYGWGLYLPYTEGWLPGHHQATVFYGTVISHIAFSLLFFGVLHTGLVIFPAIPILLIISLRPYWRSASRVVVYLFWLLGLYIITSIALLPAATNSYLHHNALDVQPWGKTYRTSYVGSQLDDILGTLMVSECSHWGWCVPVYRHRGLITYDAAQEIRPHYDAAKDLLKVAVESGGYVRSRDKQLCPTEGSEVDACFVNY